MRVKGLLLVLTSLFITGCAHRPAPAPPPGPAAYWVWVVQHHWHTSLMLPAAALVQQEPQLQPQQGRQPWVSLGFGDGDYFYGNDKGVFAAGRALVASRFAAIQVLPYDTPPTPFPPTPAPVRLGLTATQYSHLLAFIRSSFARTPEGTLIPLGECSETSGCFYQAAKGYSLVNNCNDWSAQALRAAGFAVGWQLTAKGVMGRSREWAGGKDS